MRSPAVKPARSSGTWPNCFESRGSLSYWRGRLMPLWQRSGTSGGRSIGLANNRRSRGNCGRPQASDDFCETKIGYLRLIGCWARCTTDLRKVLARQTCEKRTTCWSDWCSPKTHRRRLGLDQRGDHSISRQNRMREGGAINFVRRVHGLGAERCCGIAHQGDVIAEFRAVARGALDAGVREHACDDDLLDAALLELEIEVGVGKPVLAPMLLNRDVAWLGHQFRVPVAAPHTLSKDRLAIGQGLRGARMTPSIVIPFAPLAVRYIEHHDTRAARGLKERPQMRQ